MYHRRRNYTLVERIQKEQIYTRIRHACIDFLTSISAYCFPSFSNSLRRQYRNMRISRSHHHHRLLEIDICFEANQIYVVSLLLFFLNSRPSSISPLNWVLCMVLNYSQTKEMRSGGSFVPSFVQYL